LERKQRTSLYQRIFSRRNVQHLTEQDFVDAVKRLWASRIWRNKDYFTGKILADNGIEKIRSALQILLYGEMPLEKRFDFFSSRIRGLGTSSITELLAFVFPNEYGIWNDKPKNVFPLLGLDRLLPERAFKHQLTGKDYVACNDLLKQIRVEMQTFGFEDVDLLDVDILMWLLFLEEVKKRGREDQDRKESEVDFEHLTHWDVMGMLLELGQMLGYDTYVADPSRRSQLLGKSLGEIALLSEVPPFTYERYLNTVRRVDVLWFKEEFPAYCFEVEHTTGMTKGLLRLYQIRNLVDVGFVVVAPSEARPKFDTEVSKDPFYKIRERYLFRSYDDLVRFYKEAKRYYSIRNEFFGMNQ